MGGKMSFRLKMLASAAMVIGLGVAGAHASTDKLQPVSAIAMPGKALQGFDISYIDQQTNKFYLADGSNASVDIFDVTSGKYSGRIGGFKGFHGDVSTVGPSGIVVADGQLWATDGDSSIKIVDLKTNKIIGSVSTGGADRADEVDFDPQDHIVGIDNDSDTPPFFTLISTKPGHKVLARITFPDATGGLDKPTYYAGTGMFYVSVPELNHVANHGAIAVINPRTAKIIKMIPVDDCIPAGSAFGPNGNFVVGCDAGSKDFNMPPRTVILNANGNTVATLSQVGGIDEVAYNPVTRQYYVAAAGMPGGPVVGVIDADTNTWVQNMPTGGHTHSLAVSEADSRVLVPRPAKGGNCGTYGCIGVYAPVTSSQ